ncbi:MAG: hypothetical protein JWN78_110 [Bacteroidota bacterium]|nr:hypothetical protein [Bacteroidota bacterium]
MTNDIINSISERYIELYEHIMGKKFIKADVAGNEKPMKDAIETSLQRLDE